MTPFLKKHTSYIFSFLFVLGILFSITTYAAPTQQTLGFQGEFFNYGTPGNAPVQATFTFHTTETGNTPSGSPITKIIPVVHGYFATEFTDTDTQGVDFNQQLYLEISINGTTLAPRTPVRPSVASFKTFGTFSHATPPTPGIAGSLYFNTTTNELYVSTGSAWQRAGTASTTQQWFSNGSDLYFTTGNVGVGTSTPISKLTVLSPQGNSQGIMSVYHSNSAFDGGGMSVYRARGTPSSPQSVNNYDILGGILLGGYDGSNYLNTAYILANNAGNAGVGTGVIPTDLEFWTGNGASVAKRLTIKSDGKVGIGGSLTSVGAQLAVRGTNSDPIFSALNGAGTSVLSVLGTGNVGIGTSTPGASLTVAGNALISNSATSLFTINETTQGGVAKLQFQSGANDAAYIQTSSDGGILSFGITRGVQTMNFVNGGGTRMSINSAGLVGIKNTSGSALTTNLLEIGNLSNNLYYPKTSEVSIGSQNPANVALTLSGAPSQTGNIFEVNDAFGNTFMNVDSAGKANFSAQLVASAGVSFGSYFQFNTSGSSLRLYNASQNSYPIWLDALNSNLSFNPTGGNVGIGTTTPGQKLSIQGGQYVSLGVTVGTSNIANTGQVRANEIVSETGVQWLGGGMRLNGTFIQRASGPKIDFGDINGTAISLDTGTQTYTNGSLLTLANAGSEKFRVAYDGNVGIGTQNPARQLAIEGTSGEVGVRIRRGDSNKYTELFTDNTTAFWSITNLANFGLMGGNVGIGTASPGSLLEVQNTGDTTAGIRINNGTGRYQLGVGVSAANDGKFSIYDVNVGGAAGNRMVIDTAGLVGLGTLTPQTRLHLYGNNAVNAGLVLQNSSYSAGTTGGIILSQEDNGAFSLGRYGEADYMRVLTNGNVGIGTAAPISKLSNMTVNIVDQGLTGINGGQSFSWGIAGDGYVQALTNTAPTGSANGLLVKILATSSSSRIFTANANGIDVFTVLGSGNVGIGTTTPLSKLSVVGNIASTDLLGGITTLSVDANGNIIRTPSDQSLKTNIETLTSALEKVNQIRGVRYNWIDTTRFGSSSEIGFIAQELETVVPEVVKSGGEYKSVNYQNMVALLVEAVKELSAKFDGFSTKVKTEELCIGETCIKEEELKDFKRFRDSQMNTSNSSTNSTSNSGSDEVIDTATSSPVQENPEPTIDPIPDAPVDVTQ